MDIDVILEPDLNPRQVAELAVVAEQLGIRALWSSNYHQHWDCWLALGPAAAATSRILLGPLAVSPWEVHPLKMANALLTLNEMTAGRAILGVSGGGGVLGAIGWRAETDGPVWPAANPVTRTRYPDRRVRGVRECIEILNLARGGELTRGYDGGTFVVTRPFQMSWAQSPQPLIYSLSNGPQMIAMASRSADGIQFSDFTPDRVAPAIERAEESMPKEKSAAFRFSNFWAWHIKEDAEAAMREARRELIWRGAIIGRETNELAKLVNPEEIGIIMSNFASFQKASWTRSGVVEGVPPDLVSRLIAGLASAGDLSCLETELARFQEFKAAGLTELALRLHDDPMDALRLVGEHVVPALA